MSAHDTLDLIRSLAKRIAREREVSHTKGLNLTAIHFGFPHWPDLSSAYEGGWRPTPAQFDDLHHTMRFAPSFDDTTLAIALLGESLIFDRWEPDADTVYGCLGGQKFYLSGDEFRIAFGTQGWEILLDQAPLAEPRLKRLGKPVKSVEKLDPDLVKHASQLLKIRARQMHAIVIADWPEPSTRPDPHGNVQHPLFGGVDNQWHCLHCDAEISGPRLAANLWHCPDCGATPMDIFTEPFWDEEKVSA